jgi:NADH dehydrogenase
MARVFLTGATGFLGLRVAAQLRERGHHVTALQRHADHDRDAVIGDLTNPAEWGSRLAGHDVIVHLAALTGKAPKLEYARVNVGGTRALIEAAHHAGVPRLLFCSSIAATFPNLGSYPYAESKVAAEALVRQSGLRTTIVRPTMIAGTGSPVVSKLAELAALPVIPLFGDGRVRVQPILVEDLAAFIVDCVEADRFDGEILELGGRDVLTIRQMLGRLHDQQRPAAGRFLSVPMGLVLPVVGLLESLAGPKVPMTVGQLSTFRFDGVARPNSLWNARRDRLASLDAVLALAPRS